ncbi:MAG: FKBP-type peptidyl-prolyl cis-trans isomerase [Fimbriimonadaceae bacterium]|nr:FKBP-type peptidyl-prolyl cis-trans isomerase [Fimbriimonadaceae bacterium]QYK54998.1 MAG: FKBP-type peptidyl-prolyl cis-trans isomerase [Fimbriimonadaceae bacterium]
MPLVLVALLSILSQEAPPQVVKVTVRDEVVGTGEVAERGTVATCELAVWVDDRLKVDTATRRMPYRFKVSTEERGNWRGRVAGLRVGGVRTITVPKELFGEEKISVFQEPGAVRIRVELLAVTK